jgi:hypothetical protein
MSELHVWYERYGGHFAIATSDAEANAIAERAGHWGLEWFAQPPDEKLTLWFTQGKVRAFESISRADHVHATRFEKTHAEWVRVLGKGVAQLRCPFIDGDEQAVRWCALRIGMDLKPRHIAAAMSRAPTFDDAAVVERIARVMWNASWPEGSVDRTWDRATSGEASSWRNAARAAMAEMRAMQREERAAKPLLFHRTSEPGVVLTEAQMWERIDAAEAKLREIGR